MNLRAAVVGVGFVGKAHIEALRRLGIPIQGVLGSSVTRTEEACRGLGLSRAYTSLEELVGDSSVDVVHVCTPNYLHFLETQAALQSGKHVMCEKPLAMNTQDTRPKRTRSQALWLRRTGDASLRNRYLFKRTPEKRSAGPCEPRRTVSSWPFRTTCMFQSPRPNWA